MAWILSSLDNKKRANLDEVYRDTEIKEENSHDYDR